MISRLNSENVILPHFDDDEDDHDVDAEKETAS